MKRILAVLLTAGLMALSVAVAAQQPGVPQAAPHQLGVPRQPAATMPWTPPQRQAVTPQQAGTTGWATPQQPMAGQPMTRPLQVIELKYISPELAAYVLGGEVIYDMGPSVHQGGTGGYAGGLGGYGGYGGRNTGTGRTSQDSGYGYQDRGTTTRGTTRDTTRGGYW